MTSLLLQVPLLCIVTNLLILFMTKCKIQNNWLVNFKISKKKLQKFNLIFFFIQLYSKDCILAILSFCQGIVVVLFYMFHWTINYWDLRDTFFLPVATSTSVCCLCFFEFRPNFFLPFAVFCFHNLPFVLGDKLQQCWLSVLR